MTWREIDRELRALGYPHRRRFARPEDLPEPLRSSLSLATDMREAAERHSSGAAARTSARLQALRDLLAAQPVPPQVIPLRLPDLDPPVTVYWLAELGPELFEES